MNKRCLIIVDMQIGFINKYTVSLPEKIAQFIKTHPSIDSVIATRYCNTTETACYKLGNWKECMKGTSDADLSPQIIPYVQRVFDKSTFSGFTTELKKFLNQNAFDKIYFCGVNTDCCVLSTIFSCYDSVQDCTVIGDLCASTLGEQKHYNALELMRDNITSHRVINSWEIAD